MRSVQTAFFALATVAALGLPSQAPAAFITSASGVTNPSLTIDFSQFTSTIKWPRSRSNWRTGRAECDLGVGQHFLDSL